jgi:hypothetical protein
MQNGRCQILLGLYKMLPRLCNQRRLILGSENISLSYTFKKQLIKKISVNDLVFNIQVLNPFMWGGDVVKWGINPMMTPTGP